MATSTSSTKRSRKNKTTDAPGPGGPWSGNAPRRLRKLYDTEENYQGWILWRRHLKKRKPLPLTKLFTGRGSPLLWALPPETNVEAADQVIELLRRPRQAERRTAGLANAALCWLSRAEVAARDVGFAVECLAWCTALPALAAHLTPNLWWQLVNRLLAIATAQPQDDDPLAVQMLHGELPAALAYSLPELAACASLVAASRRTLDSSNDAILDEDGMVAGDRLDDLRPLIACWTRWRKISAQMDTPIWRGAQPRRFARLVEYALRLSRADGTQLFGPADAPAWDKRLVKAALELCDSARTERVARLLATGGKGSGNPHRRRAAPSIDLDAAGIAILRSSWRRRSPQLAVNFCEPELLLELSLGRRTLLSGTARIELSIDGRSLVPRHGWEQICWESDGDVDYLELELRFAEDVSVQRHLLLARDAGFALLADAVLGDNPRDLAYRGTWPLAPEARFRGEQETREGTLHVGDRPRARVFPLALSEWRSGPSWGTLDADEQGQLALVQQSRGCSMFAPLFIDFDSDRLRKEATWRQLTVGEARQAVPRDVAVGFRVQAGKRQWLVYRSLGEVGVRTVLGQNLRHEFLVGRFGPQGDVQKLLEIEV